MDGEWRKEFYKNIGWASSSATAWPSHLSPFLLRERESCGRMRIVSHHFESEKDLNVWLGWSRVVGGKMTFLGWHICSEFSSYAQ